MTDKPIGTRQSVTRNVRVRVYLAEGELPDMQMSYGSKTFAPAAVELPFVSINGAAWRPQSITVQGVERLKSGGLGQRDFKCTYMGSRHDWPDWLASMVDRHTPAPVADDDLPIVPAATDLDGA